MLGLQYKLKQFSLKMKCFIQKILMFILAYRHGFYETSKMALSINRNVRRWIFCCRYVDESMDEEYREDTKGPMVNGHAVPVRESPHKPSPSVPRLQSMDSEDYPEENGDTILQDIINEEDDTAGPLIPPPQGFRSPGHAQGRALSQSIPQVGILLFLFLKYRYLLLSYMYIHYTVYQYWFIFLCRILCCNLIRKRHPFCLLCCQ